MASQNDTVFRETIARGESLASLGWRIVDAHAHLGPTGTFHIPEPTSQRMVALMDRVGIATTCLASHLSIGCDYRRGNDETAQATRDFPGRLCGYVAVNPHYADDVVPELERGLDVLGMRGIKLHPTTHDYSLADPLCEPILEFAQQRSACVLVHTWGGDSRCDPKVVAKVAARFPQVSFLLGHSGGTAAGRRTSVALVADHPNLYLEICSSWLKCPELRWMVDEAGADRVIFGTDTPWLDPRFMMGKVAYAGLTDDELRLVLGDNIRRLMDLP